MRPFLMGLLLLGFTACDAAKKSPQSMQLLEFGTFKRLASGPDLQAPGAISALGIRFQKSRLSNAPRTSLLVQARRLDFASGCRIMGTATLLRAVQNAFTRE
jgi:hypothetical protein